MVEKLNLDYHLNAIGHFFTQDNPLNFRKHISSFKKFFKKKTLVENMIGLKKKQQLHSNP